MIFNKHFELAGQHAFLSASKYHWLNYDEEKLARSVITAMSAQRGTELHEFAHRAIKLGVKLPRNGKTLNMYVNDALGFRMTSEQVLYYSPNVFGTADTIHFDEEELFLRIHDLKNGVSPTSEKQLEIYAALFCLEYGHKPHMLSGIELRIYQSDEMRPYVPDPDWILHIMDKIVAYDILINEVRKEAMS